MFRLLHITARRGVFSGELCLLGRSRYLSSTIVKSPPSSAPREAPVPLVFPTIRGWYDRESKHGIATYAAMLRELGFTTIEVDLDLPGGSKKARLDDIIRDYAKELRSEISLASIFPPVLVARGVSTLAVHAYVESYPVSGIGLIGPVSLVPQTLHPPGSSRPNLESSEGTIPETFPIPKFTYEATFPICLIESAKAFLHQTRSSPWMQTEISEVKGDLGLRDESRIYDILRSWLDQIGI